MEINYTKLTISIFIALFFALFFNKLIEEGLNNYKLSKIANGFKKASEQLESKNKKNIEELQKIARNQARQAQIAIEKRNKEHQERIRKQKAQAAIRKTNMKTCNFWQKEYLEKRTEYAKAYMESSCKRAMSY